MLEATFHMTQLNIWAFILRRGRRDCCCILSLHSDSCTTYQRAPYAKAPRSAKGSQGAKMTSPPPMSHLPTPNPSANLATSLWCSASEKQRKPAWARAESSVAPAPHPPPSLNFFLPYVHSHKITVLMRTWRCLFFTLDITSLSEHRWSTFAKRTLLFHCQCFERTDFIPVLNVSDT